MISPTHVMEVDVDTETESEDDNDTVNIYEEVFNEHNRKQTERFGRLSTTSSVYSGYISNLEYKEGLLNLQEKVK